MKKLILGLTAIIVTASAFAQSPTILAPAPTPVPRIIDLTPLLLTGSQAQQLAALLASTNICVLPDGNTLMDIRYVAVKPITSGSNAGMVELRLSVAPPLTTGS